MEIDAFVIILTTKEEKDRIQEYALKKNLSLSNFCMQVIKREVNKEK